MASFRTGFKIFGEISLKQGLGRIRSFSEDRKPGQWLPEDQWAVRQPGCTCPDKREKPKPPKASKSWLSLCKDPEPTCTLECDIRHNNCPPPPPVTKEGPWYSLDNLLSKKKPSEKPPPLCSCREEMKKCSEKEEVGEKEIDCPFVVDNKPNTSECPSTQEPCPAPVISLSTPLPKELDIMLWCGKPSKDTTRIAAKCFSDRLPFQEFRPQKMWKPPPFQIPSKAESCPTRSTFCYSGPVAYSEFKQVELPKPLYTRYKSVELCDKNFLLSMTNATCPEDNSNNNNNNSCKDSSQSSNSSPPPKPSKPSKPVKICKPHTENKKECSNQREFLEAASCKPVRIKKAPKYIFRPKPTKLVEKKVFKNPLQMHKSCDLNFRPAAEKTDESECDVEQTIPCKVLASSLKEESETYEKDHILPCGPPSWMCVLNKSESDQSQKKNELPKEPDWCSETDGLKFYDGDNKGIIPKPSPDPYLSLCAKSQVKETKPVEPKLPCDNVKEPGSDTTNKFVLMPERFNIKKSSSIELFKESEEKKEEKDIPDFEKFIQSKTPRTLNKKSSQPMKENILYDLQRLCPNPPVDTLKGPVPCQKATDSDCQQPVNFYRRFSTFSSSKLPNLAALQVQKTQWRSECGDSFGKCKVRPRSKIHRQRECTEKKIPDCSEIQLPCCPKARIPPQCNLRRPQPPCKKKLPPKPSFSECTKDPLPCPKFTECNCWEKKSGKSEPH